MLSGFVLTYSLRNGPLDLVGFAIKRVFRLVPIHYVTLAAMLILAAVAARSVPLLDLPLLPRTITSDVLLITPVFWQDPINVPAWSVTWELFLPIGAIALTRPLGRLIKRWSVPILIALAVGISIAAYGVAGGGHLYGPRAFMGLLAGACLYVSYDRLPLPRWLFRASTIYALVAAMVAVMLVAASYRPVAALFPWLALATVLSGTRTRSLLSSRPMAWLGRISFTLYMVHVPVLVAAAVLLGDIAGSYAAKGAAVITSLAVATLLTATVERWGMNLGRAITLRRGRRAEMATA
jgi:peptidoglycan/LPS O-acetylase OafA/YrhL